MKDFLLSFTLFLLSCAHPVDGAADEHTPVASFIRLSVWNYRSARLECFLEKSGAPAFQDEVRATLQSSLDRRDNIAIRMRIENHGWKPLEANWVIAAKC